MNLFDSQRLLPCLAGFAMSAALLWLGSEVFATARSRSLALARRLKVCAILLAGCGLWFPGHFLEPLDAAGTGFFGIAFVAGGLAIALEASTLFSRLLAGAVTLIFFTYAFVNMGMVSGILPVVGVPLPFISYGGTAMVTLGMGLGILMSISKARRLVQS